MTLLAPLFLLGVLAIGLPIWLHRLSSENPNKQAFSSLMFLEPGEPRRVLAKNLQYLLLLALRIGFLVLLALAFAGPAIWRTPAAGGGGDGATLRLIVLDASASMAYRDRWTDAQDAARDVIAELGAEDVGQVIAVGRTAELLTQQTRDPAVLRAAVANAEPGIFRLDFGAMMDALDGIVRASELPVEIHVVTDAQATGLPSRFADLAPGGSAALAIHDTGAGPADNWAIESLAGSGVTGALEATLRSFAATAAAKTVELRLEGEIVERQEITVAPGGTAQVEFEPVALRAGSNRVDARFAAGDDFPIDDRRFIALRRPEPRPVLLVASGLRARDTLFIASALETLGALAIEAEQTTVDGFDDYTLADFHFVVVAEAGALRSEHVAALQGYVESGGAVLLALGPGSTGLTEVPLTGQTILPASLSGREAATGIGVIDTAHPALRGLEALRGASYRRYAGLQPAPGEDVLLALETGAPLLVEREIGAGRVLVYGSTLDREWNDLAVLPVFVPFVSGVANHLLGNAGFASQASLGGTLAVRALGLGGGQIFDTTGEVALGLGGTGDVLLDQIGYYEVVGGGVSQYIAVNFDTLESDLSVMDADAIDRWQRLGSELGQGAVVAAAAGEPVLAPLGLWVLALLALLIVMETWAGNWHLRVQRGISA